MAGKSLLIKVFVKVEQYMYVCWWKRTYIRKKTNNWIATQTNINKSDLLSYGGLNKKGVFILI